MVNKYPYKSHDDRWYKPCHNCGNMQSYLRYHYALNSLNLKKLCKKCSNKLPENNAHKGWHKDVLRLSFIRKYKINAAVRKINWDVDDDYLSDLLINQNFKCALSGWDINAMNVNKNTASLDRIDSKLGYVKGNLQWVHKMVNMCKQQYTQEDFIKMCVSVSDKVKWSPSNTSQPKNKKWVKGS
jgi:hypothetical protein